MAVTKTTNIQLEKCSGHQASWFSHESGTIALSIQSTPKMQINVQMSPDDVERLCRAGLRHRNEIGPVPTFKPDETVWYAPSGAKETWFKATVDGLPRKIRGTWRLRIRDLPPEYKNGRSCADVVIERLKRLPPEPVAEGVRVFHAKDQGDPR